ncbi:MAG: hypothetical protein SWK76_02680 [Actinomycetota bacterium]|nr:hypothetical protein [Actinomycetota bacterium]
MEIKRNEIVPLGYGKYYRSDKIVGIEPIGENNDRGPARRTYVYIDGMTEPVVASRAENSILNDLVISRREVDATVALDLMERMLHEMEKVGPILRRSIREETGLDMDEIILRIRYLLSREEEEGYDQGSLFTS